MRPPPRLVRDLLRCAVRIDPESRLLPVRDGLREQNGTIFAQEVDPLTTSEPVDLLDECPAKTRSTEAAPYDEVGKIGLQLAVAEQLCETSYITVCTCNDGRNSRCGQHPKCTLSIVGKAHPALGLAQPQDPIEVPWVKGSNLRHADGLPAIRPARFDLCEVPLPGTEGTLPWARALADSHVRRPVPIEASTGT